MRASAQLDQPDLAKGTGQVAGELLHRRQGNYLAYLAATGADPSAEASILALRRAFGTHDALLELVYDDPLSAWTDIPVLELSGRVRAGEAHIAVGRVVVGDGDDPAGVADPPTPTGELRRG